MIKTKWIKTTFLVQPGVKSWARQASVEWGKSPCRIDGAKLAQDMKTAMEALQDQGYEILHITEVLSGTYGYHPYSNSSLSADTAVSFGWSFLEGVVITARK
jgi:hypothetical protein